MEEASEAYPDFLSSVCSTTLIRSPVGTVSYRKTLINETKAKIEILQNLGLRVCQYQEIKGSLAISDWDVIIIQVESTHCIELHGRRPYVVILDEVNAVICQMFSGVYARESENAMRDLLKSAIHVVVMDAFANDSTIAFLKQYRGNDIRIFDNKYQPRIGETVKILYDLDKGSEAMKRGISNIKTGVHVEAFAQMLYQIQNYPQRIISLYNSQKSSEIFQEPNCSLIRAELSALRPIDLPTAAEYQRRLSAKYFSEILCGLVFNTRASLEIISTEGTIADRKMVSNIIKAVEKNIKGSNAELIINTPDITPDDAEVFKQIPTARDIGGKDDNQNWGVDDAKWINLYNISFVKKFNNPEPLRHFRRLAYFRRQGFTGIDDIRTLSSNIISEAFAQSYLKSAIKAINAIAGNWCGYTVKSDKKRIGPKGQQVWQYSYQINHRSYSNSTGFGDKHAPELPPYRSKTDNDIQELLDSIG
ncbi:hypothetical protein GLOIN_2v1776159 [Rhizophagus clarus]|uniref:Replication origin-binding protein domain-containing protein n=1 Tax=Rhizophagus clarus TaxID=94130 RepID=A0A8H3QRH8_9GLOM|nr:hypothetical protein GLOIN_2v1776159 [Rhizophagus clarus]